MIQHSGRQLLYRADYLRAAVDRASAVVAAEYQDEISALRAEVDELREVALLLVTLMRERCEGDLASLRAQLEGALVRLTHRDPAHPLH